MGEVKVIGVKCSPFSLRVEIALKLKGVDYEYVEVDLNNKSEELLKYNPIHKKIPILIHNGMPIVESLVILEYIDETWKHGYQPLLPIDPFERAHAHFWANFIDSKLINATFALTLAKDEEKKEKAKEELKDLIKIFENEVKGKKFLMGNEIGYLDLVAIIVALMWVPILIGAIDEEILSRNKLTQFWAWADQLLGFDIVKETMPSTENLVAFYQDRIIAYSSK